MSTENAAHTTSSRKLLLCDDHWLILDGVASLLRKDFNVLPVNSSQKCMETAQTFRPDLVVLDVEMPGDHSGFIVAKKLHETQPNLPVIFLSMHSDADYIERAVQVGAKAYVPKSVSADALLSCLHAVLNGESFLNASKLQPFSTMQGASGNCARELLTARQRQILRLIARGYSAKDIAHELNISPRTAEFHRKNIIERLNIHSTAQLTRFAFSHNLA